MALDLEDQEQLDEFKVWWNKYGKLTINLVLLMVVAYASWQAYQYFQHKKAVEASDIYQGLVQLDPAKIDLVKVEAAKLMDGYSATPYAGRAAVFLAKSNFAAEDAKSAKSQLEWAVANAEESAVKAIASLQLATLLLDEKDYAGAEKVLAADIDKGFAGLKDGLLGDVFVAQGKITKAKESYERALTNLDGDGRLSLFTQQKLDSLGS
ncbi:MAG: tetratricopeptide repeat protein [Methylophilaceae bacterium]